ncbi:MAG: amino acid ABC transporter substrate-binding protein [Microcoleus sp. PH2017_29_MFU_D_A]|uniref:amino acid ABC transporter substrate-binding protein n=1 Tax=unclassified Microcoleus TaxID=2642155 RepID=UPI001DDBC2F1|nr:MULTISPECIES: amino acid ABC transporter substrate-binding protein [unclassified Microcoleus]MCC3416397.1 amino acid ABC transporter substrate-binding protein [Microcoleus sp. PH2017_07_MST_O_A]MCC3410895.1 amino acid ABC transporter substrate-binding protein [Microcoleus sp. PH2017_02_FOX_O_A]MCC3453424.1 amino acid ABC transporter substrate-binding protein [Microcoleus sp. PH2017_08_TRC_O_A]MCC3583677.1 amino acid ABC transporter substrate-binding protein [Microcoleus sp. PH2017_30_WIL_O_A
MTIPNYNETTYLQENPEVAKAVASGLIPNGFEHWVKFGFTEKRKPQISFNEQFYLDANPEVAAAVAKGSLSSGFEHYARFGAAEGRKPVASTTPTGPKLQEILKRGFVRVAVNDDAIGFSKRESDGSFSGIGIDFSRALATALFDNPKAVEFVVVEAGKDFNSVASGAVDIAATLPTQSMLRDGSLGVDFSPTVFFDTQAVLVRGNSGISSVKQLPGTTIGVLAGTRSQQNLIDVAKRAGIALNIQTFPSQDTLFAAYDAGKLGAVSINRGVLSNRIPTLSNPGNQVILDEAISKEPLALVVPENQSEWADVVRWVVSAPIQAEFFGINSQNVNEFLNKNSATKSFLGVEGKLGESLGLKNDFALKVIKQIGNYEEIYNRNFNPKVLPRGLNELMFVKPGGLLYYLPFSGTDQLTVPLVNNDNRNVLQEVLDRGFVRVGVRNDAPGVGFADSKGNFSGFDVDFGRALAASLFGNPNAVEFVIQKTGPQRFSDVANGIVDVTSRNASHNLKRDALLGVDFAPINSYDAQFVVTPTASGITSFEQLAGRRIGVSANTNSEVTLREKLKAAGINAEVVALNSLEALFDRYIKGELDALTGNGNLIISSLLTLPPDQRDKHQPFPDVLGEEPLAMVVDENQSQWKDVVTGVTYSVYEALELGITSENVRQQINSSDPVVRRFLGVEGTVGESLGLSNNFALNAISAVGNYQEMTDRNFPGFSVNPLLVPYTEGGVLFSVPFA